MMAHIFVRSLLIGLLVILIHSSGVSQDVERTVETLKDRLADNPIDVSGGLNLNVRFNSISGMDRRRDPFGINLMAHTTFDVLGIKAPFAIAIADRNATYRLPAYSFVGLSPSYKWAKLHLFRRSMNFSRYSLNGHGFNGAGMELTPGKFKFSAMYGTLRKARLQDFGLRQELDDFYRRTGYGIQVGYADNQDEILLNIFRANDDETSLPEAARDLIGAKDNLVTSLTLRKAISNTISIEGEYAYSIFTNEKGFPERAGIGIGKIFERLMDVNSTSSAASAYHFDLQINPKNVGNFTIGYERVNPDFVSLGTFQFQNDFENFTVGYSGRIFKKMTLFGRIGLERNNLDAQEIENRNRFVGQAQISYPFSKKWSNSLSYSNFRQTTRVTDATNINEVVDSIFLGSTSNLFSLNSNYLLNEMHSLNASVSYQQANTISNDIITSRTTEVLNFLLNYLYRPKEKSYSGGLSLMWNSLISSDITSSALTPAGRFIYKFSDTWNASLFIAQNFGFVNSETTGNLFRMGISSSYAINDRQRIQLRIVNVRRSGDRQNFSEVNAHVGYSWSF